jgi:hypothetical protein
MEVVSPLETLPPGDPNGGVVYEWMEVNGQVHAPVVLPAAKNHGTHSKWGWLGPIDGPDVLEKRKNLLPLPGSESRTVQPVA